MSKLGKPIFELARRFVLAILSVKKDAQAFWTAQVALGCTIFMKSRFLNASIPGTVCLIFLLCLPGKKPGRHKTKKHVVGTGF